MLSTLSALLCMLLLVVVVVVLLKQTHGPVDLEEVMADFEAQPEMTATAP